MEVLIPSGLSEHIECLYALPVAVIADAFAPARQRGNANEPYSCSVEFPLNGTFNAGSRAIDGGTSLITINAAVPYLLLTACVLYSCRADPLSGLPICEGTRVVSFHERILIPSALVSCPQLPSQFDQLFEQMMEDVAPYAPNVSYALFLYELAIRFIAWHEAMHVILGHTAFTQAEYGLESLMEISAGRESRLTKRLSHTLEFCADRNAIRGLARRLMLRDSNLISVGTDKLLGATPLNPDSYLLRGLMTAFTLLFHLFPTREASLGLHIHSHPSPYLRAQWACMEIGHEMGSESNFRMVFETIAFVAAAMSANFSAPGNWRRATELDVDPEFAVRPKLTDDSYKRILKSSRRWSQRIHDDFGPLYNTA